MSISSLLGLLFCNLLWSATYTVGKVLMTDFHPLEISFLRYLIGVIPLLAWCLRGGRYSLFSQWTRSIGRVDLRILIAGVLTFYLSPLCQMTGLSLSRAVDSSLMIAMEPLFTIAAAWIVLRERVRAHQVLALVGALTGVAILTELTWVKIISFSDARLIGNSIFILSLVSEAGFSIISKPALDRRSPVLVMALAVCIGVVLLFAHNMIVDGPQRMAGLVPLFSARFRDVALILFLAFGCTTFAYLYWLVVLRNAPVSSMVLTLYIQPVVGLLLGHWWLGEAITSSTLVGTALIFAAVWLGSRGTSRAPKAA